MAWVRIDDGYRLHPKMQLVGPLGRDLFLGALCHANRYLTDGWLALHEFKTLADYDGLFIEPPSTLPGIYEQPKIEDVMESLIQASLLEWHDGRLLIHDYAQFQPTRAEVVAQRERWRERKRQQRVSGFKKRLSLGESGSGELEKAVHAREAVICPVCGPMPFASSRLHEHLENLHPELAAEAARAS